MKTAKKTIARHKTYAGAAVPDAFLEFARARKAKYGININRTISDALTYSLEHREEWTKNFS